MEVRIRQGRKKDSEAFARFHRVVCDEPFDEGGSDTGMTPSELMLAALGCCAMHFAAEYLRTRNLAPDNVELRVYGQKGDQPARLNEIGIEVDAPGLSNRAREGLMKAVEGCVLHRTLLNPPRVKITMATSVVEGPAPARRAGLVT